MCLSLFSFPLQLHCLSFSRSCCFLSGSPCPYLLLPDICFVRSIASLYTIAAPSSIFLIFPLDSLSISLLVSFTVSSCFILSNLVLSYRICPSCLVSSCPFSHYLSLSLHIFPGISLLLSLSRRHGGRRETRAGGGITKTRGLCPRRRRQGGQA